MAKPTKKPNLSSNWDAEQIRCTMFFQVSPLTIELDELWAKYGDADAEVIKQPNQQRVQYKQNLGDYLFMMSAEIDRIHWTLASDKFTEDVVDTSYSKMQREFIGSVSPWLGEDALPPLVRIAYGAVLNMPCESKKQGYEKLQEYLPDVKLDPVASYDFSYQINRRRNSKIIEDLEYINRLSAWSVAKFTKMAIQIGGQGTKGLPIGAAFFSCRLALDINTPVENTKPFDHLGIPKLFDELCKAGVEIADFGDIS